MDWDKLFAKHKEWRARLDAWIATQDPDLRPVDCRDYIREHGGIAGWKEQLERNRDLEHALVQKYIAEVEAMPEVVSLVIC